MGWASEMQIREHNEMMETSEWYRQQFEQYLEETRAMVWDEIDETQIDWFEDYRLSYDGLEEFDN